MWQVFREIEDNEFKQNFHIDHVVILSTFDWLNPENQFIAFNWQNTQFLLKCKNLSKHNKRDLLS